MHRDVIFASEACLSVLVARIIMSTRCAGVGGFMCAGVRGSCFAFRDSHTGR